MAPFPITASHGRTVKRLRHCTQVRWLSRPFRNPDSDCLSGRPSLISAFESAVHSTWLDSTMSFASFASFAVLSLRNILGAPSTKIHINGTTFVSYILPPLVCYCLAAVLAVTPQTRTIRVALGPLVVLLALRAALSVDMSLGRPERKFLNIDLVVSVCRNEALQAHWRTD